MPPNIKSIKQSLTPAFLRQSPNREEIELFKKEFRQLLDRINMKESTVLEIEKNISQINEKQIRRSVKKSIQI